MTTPPEPTLAIPASPELALDPESLRPGLRPAHIGSHQPSSVVGGHQRLFIVMAIVIAAILVVAAAFACLLLPLSNPLETPPRPPVALGAVSLVDGNATFEVVGVNPAAAGPSFDVNLRIGSSTGTAVSLVEAPEFAIVVVSEHRYRVYWDDIAGQGALSPGDRFTITGDGHVLPPGMNFTFFLTDRTRGDLVAMTGWTMEGLQRPAIVSMRMSQGENASFLVAGVTHSLPPSYYRANLRVGATYGTSGKMPTTSDTFVNLTIDGALFRIYWIDAGDEGTLNVEDVFRITGNGTALPGATSFTFQVLWFDGSLIYEAAWTTP